VLVSQLLKDGLIEAKAKMQRECFESGCFARTEGILPAPESTYAIAGALDEARKADLEGVSKTILFNLSGHGHFDFPHMRSILNTRYELTQLRLKMQISKINLPA